MGRAELAANPLAMAAASATPLSRLGQPADIAAAVDFLTSDSAGYHTGHRHAFTGLPNTYFRGASQIPEMIFIKPQK
jgi:NAD(P)-dependent dehydrogenase (short-subunit alcohol dehydrogenase family)